MEGDYDWNLSCAEDTYSGSCLHNIYWIQSVTSCVVAESCCFQSSDDAASNVIMQTPLRRVGQEIVRHLPLVFRYRLDYKHQHIKDEDSSGVQWNIEQLEPDTVVSHHWFFRWRRWRWWWRWRCGCCGWFLRHVSVMKVVIRIIRMVIVVVLWLVLLGVMVGFYIGVAMGEFVCSWYFIWGWFCFERFMTVRDNTVRWFSHGNFMRVGICIQVCLRLIWTHSVRVYTRHKLTCSSPLFRWICPGLLCWFMPSVGTLCFWSIRTCLSNV